MNIEKLPDNEDCWLLTDEAMRQMAADSLDMYDTIDLPVFIHFREKLKDKK